MCRSCGGWNDNNQEFCSCGERLRAPLARRVTSASMMVLGAFLAAGSVFSAWPVPRSIFLELGSPVVLGFVAGVALLGLGYRLR